MAAEMLNKNRLMVFKNKGKDQDVSISFPLRLSQPKFGHCVRSGLSSLFERIEKSGKFRDDASFRIMNHLKNVTPSAFFIFPIIDGMLRQNVINAGHLQVALTELSPISKKKRKMCSNLIHLFDFMKIVSTTFFF